MKLGLGSGFGKGGNSRPRYVTDFTNGFELPGDTYSGGPVVTEDNTGALVTSPADVLPIEGMRLSGSTWLPTTSLGAPIHASTPLRTRKGTVSVYSEDFKGALIEPARTNKVRPQKSDPTVTTNISVTGGTLSVASDPGTLIVDAKLTKQCLTGKLFKWVNASGSTQTATLVGQAGNTNKQSLRVYAESTGAAGTVSLQGVGSVAIPNQAGLAEYTSENLTPAASTDQVQLTLADGGTMYFILPQLEEGAFLTSPICKDSTGADPLTSITRPAANLTRPTAGTALESGNNFAIYGRVVPKASGNLGTKVFSTGTPTSNYIDVGKGAATDFEFVKRINTGPYLVAKRTSFSEAVNTPFEYIAYQHSVHGMGIAVRSWNGSVWSAWSAWSTNADTQNAPIASTYQIGARNNSNHFAGNYPFTEIIKIPASVEPQAWLIEKLSQGRI